MLLVKKHKIHNEKGTLTTNRPSLNHDILTQNLLLNIKSQSE